MTDDPFKDFKFASAEAPRQQNKLDSIRARIQRNELMVNKLYDQVERGCIDNEAALQPEGLEALVVTKPRRE